MKHINPRRLTTHWARARQNARGNYGANYLGGTDLIKRGKKGPVMENQVLKNPKERWVELMDIVKTKIDMITKGEISGRLELPIFYGSYP